MASIHREGGGHAIEVVTLINLHIVVLTSNILIQLEAVLDSRISQSVTLLVEQLNQTLRTLNGQLNRINIRAGGLAGVGIGLIVGLVGVVQDQSGSNASVIHESSDGAGEIAGLTQSAQSRLDVAVLGVVILIVIAGADKDLAILIQQDVLIVGSSIVDPQSSTLAVSSETLSTFRKA